ncbi:MAG: DEAD/DEAH box helicase [Arcobacteraceae bacterium]
MSFSTLGLNASLLKAIAEQGYTQPTPIQQKAIPLILAKKDVLAGAQTGTGKTAGFTLPLLQLLSQKKPNTQKREVRALILTPTRELAAQVGESVTTYGKYLDINSIVIFGGVGINPQISALKKGVDILTATPGRLLDHIGQKTLNLSHVEFLILDEADRMLDMGFINDIKKVLSLLPKNRQNLLFSATFSDEIKRLADGLLNNPILIEVAKRNESSAQVSQKVFTLDKERKKDLLVHLIKEDNMQQALVFTKTKHGANKLCEHLIKCGISSAAIHGNKSQSARTKALDDLKKGSVRILVATDIAARGIDIDQLPHVINYELPNISEDYVHRIGRTGRAGNVGIAISLVCGEELEYLKSIERLMKKDIPQEILTGFTSKQVYTPEVKVQRGSHRNHQGQNRSNASATSTKHDNRSRVANVKHKEEETFKSHKNSSKTATPRRNRNYA